MELRLSNMRKTWILDLDGTLLRHNGYLHGGDALVDGVKEFIDSIYDTGKIVILTAREEEFREETLAFLKKAGIRYHEILFDLPWGERILINDKKPSGLETAIAVNIERDKGIHIDVVIDEEL
ncbi:MAG: HAD family acid phosphatase [Defluviitaleaceae bacterium]|nr:HAD family acid phosphatase [Defluviitaleaceae bacterium]